MAKIGVIHGPNLNLLGSREPEIYGTTTLAEIDALLTEHAGRQHELRLVQHNGEGALVDAIQELGAWGDGLIINPAAYTHTSLALRDAIKAVDVPTVEVHLSNIHARDELRRRSLTAEVCLAQVSGFGHRSYLVAFDGLLAHLE